MKDQSYYTENCYYKDLAKKKRPCVCVKYSYLMPNFESKNYDLTDDEWNTYSSLEKGFQECQSKYNRAYNFMIRFLFDTVQNKKSELTVDDVDDLANAHEFYFKHSRNAKKESTELKKSASQQNSNVGYKLNKMFVLTFYTFMAYEGFFKDPDLATKEYYENLTKSTAGSLDMNDETKKQYKHYTEFLLKKKHNIEL